MEDPKKTNMNDFIRRALGITPANQETSQPPQGNAGNGTGAPPPKNAGERINEWIRHATGWH